MKPQGCADVLRCRRESERAVPRAWSRGHRQNVDARSLALSYKRLRVREEIKMAMEINHLTPWAERNASSSAKPRPTILRSCGASGIRDDESVAPSQRSTPIARARSMPIFADRTSSKRMCSALLTDSFAYLYLVASARPPFRNAERRIRHGMHRPPCCWPKWLKRPQLGLTDANWSSNN